MFGPFGNDAVAKLAPACQQTHKPVIAPTATSEDVIRRFAVGTAGVANKKPFLWSLTETDITFCEVLLSMYASFVKSMGNDLETSTPAALFSPNDSYGRTFFDWGPYQAEEMGIPFSHNEQYTDDADLRHAVIRLINEEVVRTQPDRGCIGSNVKIVNTVEIVNSVIEDGCEISGATRLSDCTIKSNRNSSVFIGSNTIIENSIVADGSSITDGARLQDCFVGEACQLTSGFTASQSVFFANTFMSNGEACAAFCGPFCASHHKSSLLIGGEYSFYNAGSATNFSNHAYKMGPIHWGTLERGSKTASGTHLLWPAQIGAFTVVMGKLAGHPNTKGLPFSYIIGENGRTWLVPGHNIVTVGLYRDIKKWPQRDMRSEDNQKSIIDFDWLSPMTVGEILRGKKILENIVKVNGDDVAEYHYHGMCIKASSLKHGLHYYDLALKMFMGEVMEKAKKNGFDGKPTWQTGLGRWEDLAGQLLPLAEEQRLSDDIKEGNIETIDDVIDRFKEIEANYSRYEWAWAYRMILEYYGIKSITEDDEKRIDADSSAAHAEWLAAIKADAEKEFRLGDVPRDTLDGFLAKIPSQEE